MVPGGIVAPTVVDVTSAPIFKSPLIVFIPIGVPAGNVPTKRLVVDAFSVKFSSFIISTTTPPAPGLINPSLFPPTTVKTSPTIYPLPGFTRVIDVISPRAPTELILIVCPDPLPPVVLNTPVV